MRSTRRRNDEGEDATGEFEGEEEEQKWKRKKKIVVTVRKKQSSFSTIYL